MQRKGVRVSIFLSPAEFKLRSGRLAAVLVALFLGFVVPAESQVLTTRQDVRHDVSPALRDLVKASPGPPEGKPHEAEEIRRIPLPGGLKPASEPDSVLQRTATAAPESLAPTVINNFDGIGQDVPAGFSPCCAPPDTNGAVGLTQYVQWVNVSFAVFDKTTAKITLGPALGQTLWAGFGGDCETSDDGDPIVVYDKLADRWVFSQFVVNGGVGPFLQCVAVSTTSDATGTYNRYAFSYSNFDDYPKMGVWPDAYYVTFNMFGNTFLGADACAYDRNAMLNGQPATQVCFQQGSSVGSLLPSDLDGLAPPPANSPNFMMTFGTNSLNLFKFHVDFATPSNSTFTGPTVIPVAPFTPLCAGAQGCVPQPFGDGTKLDSLADRLMYRLAYRNFGDHESLVVNHAVAVDSSGGIRWYEIQNPSGTPLVAQQSTFAPDANFRWMGSIASDVNGDIALGYSVSSSTQSPSIAFAARVASDPAGTLQAETSLVTGTGSQIGNLTRWGDYSSMQVDPVDDCTFWYTQEYMKTTGAFNWNTRIASFKFPGCGLPDLTVALNHSGNFTQGQTGTYSVTVKNIGGKDTDGSTVTVTDTLPSGFTAKAASGAGWVCSLGPPITCTRSDVLAVHSSYPAITLTVNVANNAPGSVTNTVAVAGGGEQNLNNDTGSDPTTIIQNGPDLTIAKSHTGNFILGQTGVYTITVTNVGLSPADGSTVSVADTLPAGLTATAASGTGWACTLGTTITCTRSDTVASNAAYPAITVTVNVANNAPGLVVNTATVSGGGDTNALNNAAQDSTKVTPPPADLTITASHAGDFHQGQSLAFYTVTVSNLQGSGSTIGAVTVTDVFPAGLTHRLAGGDGWQCGFQICTRSDVLAAGASYPPVLFTVHVASNAPASVTNVVTVSGGGDISPGNNTATDSTTIAPAPFFKLANSHSPDPLVAGETGTYTLAVTNVGGAASSGLVTVFDQFPLEGFTSIAVNAPGWTCSQPPTTSLTCTRSDALAPGASYPPIMFTAGVSANTQPTAVTRASISGGASFNEQTDTIVDVANVLGFHFVPVTPCRIADTRLANGLFGGPFLSGQSTRGFTIPSSACNIPATAQAYSLNVTVVPHGPLGFLTTFACGQTRPQVSTLNSDGRVKAAAAIVSAGTNGDACFFVTNDTDLVLDINGYFVTGDTAGSLAFYPMAPCRLVDTRSAAGPLGGPSLVGNAARTFPVRSSPCNLPGTAQAYSLSFTSVPQGSLGFLTAWPAGQTQPLVSTLNAPTGVITANAGIVPAGANGDVSVFVTNNSDLVIDVDGYFAPPAPSGLSLFTQLPCRVLDTRIPPGSPPFSGIRNVLVVGLEGSVCAAATSARSVVLNATVVPSGPLGFLTLWPRGEIQPLVSSLNASDGVVTSNMAIVPLNVGSISAFASNPTHLVLDISGYFAPTATASPTEDEPKTPHAASGSVPLDTMSQPDSALSGNADLTVLVPLTRVFPEILQPSESRRPSRWTRLQDQDDDGRPH
jgi:uncharacterized repeat protein (TIGR01451 family)